MVQVEYSDLKEAVGGKEKVLGRASSGNTFQVGERFFESKPPHHVWIISKVYTPPASKLPHVLLDRCGRFPASKLLSIEVLRDTTFFRKDRRNPFEGDVDETKRRRLGDRRRVAT